MFTRQRVYDPRSPYTDGNRPSLGRVIKTALRNPSHPGVPPRNGSIYPDLVDFSSHELYEIKPARNAYEIRSGLNELTTAVNALHSVGLNNWRLGTDYIPPVIIPLAWILENQAKNLYYPDSFNNVTQGRFAIVRNLEPGIIVYDVLNPRLDLIGQAIGYTVAAIFTSLIYQTIEAAARNSRSPAAGLI